MAQSYDVVVIGGGIVGLSTAWQLKTARPELSVVLVEKEPAVAQHQSGHNSGVVHAGVYYPPQSLKARFCREGLAELKQFCLEHQLPFEQCGKLLVATSSLELKRMQALYQRCRENQLDVTLLSQQALKRKQPRIQGLGAIEVPDTAITDYPAVCHTLADKFQAAGGKLQLGTRVDALEESQGQVRLSTSQGEISAGFLVACAGLWADRLAKLQGLDIDFQIVPFRGEYFRLAPEMSHVVSQLIYPIPDPELPFLGIHLTKTIGGEITIGPNARLGFKREGYGRFNLDWADSSRMVKFSGFWRLMAKHWRSGLAEAKNSLSKTAYLKQAQKYCPELRPEHLQAYPAGIRAQAVMRDGSLVHDFLFAHSPRSLHVCNAPSPAATSALPIGRYLVDKVMERLAV